MYTDPHVLADRHENPKVSDVFNLFNIWRKSNLGVRAGKELFTTLEKIVIANLTVSMVVKLFFRGLLKVKNKMSSL